MALMLGALLSVTYTCIESADVYRTWLWVWVLICRRMYTFELQNFWDKVVEGKTVPWSSHFNCFCQDVENVSTHQSLRQWSDCEGTMLDLDSCTRCLIKGRGCETWLSWVALVREIGMPRLLISHWMRTPSYLLRLLEELPLSDSSRHIPVVLETSASWCVGSPQGK